VAGTRGTSLGRVGAHFAVGRIRDAHVALHAEPICPNPVCLPPQLQAICFGRFVIRLGSWGVRIGDSRVRTGSSRVRIGSLGVRTGCSSVRTGCSGVCIGSLGVRVGSSGVRAGCSSVRTGCSGVRIGGLDFSPGSWGVCFGSLGVQRGKSGVRDDFAERGTRGGGCPAKQKRARRSSAPVRGVAVGSPQRCTRALPFQMLQTWSSSAGRA
jgi:hypothetical protein